MEAESAVADLGSLKSVGKGGEDLTGRGSSGPTQRTLLGFHWLRPIHRDLLSSTLFPFGFSKFFCTLIVSNIVITDKFIKIIIQSKAYY